MTKNATTHALSAQGLKNANVLSNSQIGAANVERMRFIQMGLAERVKTALSVLI